ncbi:cation diffusion facilitator family transporter [Seinonella peptonophila]|uniref:Cation diffusion facilitator family transporter n=1 Tax=Seinonella peptonophila TaxID=112248 RepID=A0A1M4WKA1_9BACL|nr:cation diffusion facilitator family transporter [Seinonella peptonophila]SHE81635.1 cation diffusion facilitator family transporter [Seinonella peptonophila]
MKIKPWVKKIDLKINSWSKLKLMKIAALAMLILASFELFVATIAHSLALRGIALHMYADAALIAANIVVMIRANKGRTNRYNDGFDKLKALCAALNGLTLWGIALWMVVEAVERWREPQSIEGGWVMVASICGLLVNGFFAFYLNHHGEDEEEHHELIVKAVFLDMIFDMLGDLCSFAGAAIIAIGQATGQSWSLVDPAISILIAGMIFYHSGQELIRPSWTILLDKCPQSIDYAQALQGLELVVDGLQGQVKGLKIMQRGDHNIYVRCEVFLPFGEFNTESKKIDQFFNRLTKEKGFSLELDLISRALKM